MNFQRENWIADQFRRLKRKMVKVLETQLESQDGKAPIYFKAAFTRWIFNLVMKGVNPWRCEFTVEDFVDPDDLGYFSEKYPELDCSKLDWKWLDSCLARIREGPKHPLRQQHSHLEIDVAKVTVWRGGSRHQITPQQYERVRQLFNLEAELLPEYLFLLLERYSVCGTTSKHCSAPPSVIKFTRSRAELFGSPLNTVLDSYCSPFYDIERHFGSMGSFFDVELETGTYFMNPPYDERLILEASRRVVEALRSDSEITVIIVIPTWDTGAGGDFKALSELRSSGFMRSSAVLDQSVHPFYDYYKDEYACLTNTHLIVVSNTDYRLTATEIASNWQRCLKE